MPNLSRRRDIDGRNGRFESEIRASELANNVYTTRRELPSCSKCHAVFEEMSKVCPRCESKTMGYIRPIPEQHLDEARRNALRRAMRGT